jgi:hypothetical protein
VDLCTFLSESFVLSGYLIDRTSLTKLISGICNIVQPLLSNSLKFKSSFRFIFFCFGCIF